METYLECQPQEYLAGGHSVSKLSELFRGDT